jgi:long-subunit fatty acid transport protein
MRFPVRMHGSRRALALGAALLALNASPAAAQSLLANRGLGLVVEPTDGRGRGLGGVDLGLAQSDFSWINPADLIGLAAPGMRLAFQYDEFSTDFGSEVAEGSTARFPLIHLATPVGDKWALSVGFGGFLDQNFAIQSDTSVLIGVDTVAVRDRLSSEGGVARLRLGAAYRVVEGIAVGLGLDAYTGAVERAFGRQFSGEGEPGCCRTQWQYSGLGALGGLAWTPSEATTVSVAASWGGTLDAESDDTLSAPGSFDLPVTLNAGASARVAADLLAAVSAEWAGWSGLDEELVGVGGARDSWSVKGGLEYDGIQLRDRPLPIRLGARHSALPFSWSQPSVAREWTNESALTSGFGLILAGGATQADVALERGWRGGEDAGLNEAYWRVTFSVTVLGR